MQFPILNVLLENLRNCTTRRYDDDVLPDIIHTVTIDVITSDYLQVRTSRCKPQGRIAIFMPFAPRAICSHQLIWNRRNCKDSSLCEPIVRTPTNVDPVLEGKTRTQFVPPLLTNLHMRKRQIHYKRETPIFPESFTLFIKSVTKHLQLHRSVINYRRLYIRSVFHNV